MESDLTPKARAAILKQDKAREDAIREQWDLMKRALYGVSRDMNTYHGLRSLAGYMKTEFEMAIDAMKLMLPENQESEVTDGSSKE